MEIIINDNNYTVKPVMTGKDISNGMMNRKFDDDFDGMLFIMDGYDHSFWMKNCLIPLDIMFIDGNKINKIHHNCPPCNTEKCKNYEGSGEMVLEIPGGHCKKYGINEGDEIKFHY
jgi:uncharacterized membrane protein (UPF0127 family)